MDALSSIGGSAGAPASEGSEEILMLKKTQDLAKQLSAQLLEALPSPAKSPSPPGVGGHIDISV
jgi:hypothetical protein